MSRVAFAFLTAFFTTFSTIALGQSVPEIQLSPLSLPGFQQDQLRGDAPFPNVAMDQSGVVWLPGRDSIWRWSTADNTLQKIGPLLRKVSQSDRLQHVGSDGTSLFVASNLRLFQVQGTPRRVLMYESNAASDLSASDMKSLGFAGEGDNFWWLTTRKAYRVDRYGKILKPAERRLRLKESDLIAFDPLTQQLWVARDKSVVSLNLKDPKAKPLPVNRTSRKIRGLKYQNGEIWLWTDFAVVRLESDGKRIQTIPVDPGRKLVTIDIKPSKHAFLFDDGLFEIYDLQTKHVIRRMVSTAPIQAMSVGSEDSLAVLSGGMPMAFKMTRLPHFGRKSKDH
jgi:hypothetical protein